MKNQAVKPQLAIVIPAFYEEAALSATLGSSRTVQSRTRHSQV